MSSVRFIGLAFVATLALAACGDDETTSPPGPPADVTGVSGTGQTAAVATTLGDPIVVRVTDADGTALSGIQVNFAVTAGGGDLSAAVAEGLAAGDFPLQASLDVTINTDAQGEADARWTLGTTAGVQRATATVQGIAPFTFSATAEPDVPDFVALVSGDSQEGLLGADLAEPFAVAVRDQYNNGVPGETVSWAVTSGDGSFSSATSMTGSGGIAFNTLSLGQTSGEVEATATWFILPVQFEALAKAQLNDPAGDEFSTGASAGLVPPDITRMTAWRTSTDLVVEIAFVNDVVSDDTGGPNVVLGSLDIDVDQDPTTGVTANTDSFGGATGMGMDFFISMFMGGSGVYTVSDVSGPSPGTITPVFNANVMTLTIPLALLGGDDGLVDLATVVGTSPEPTDVAPNTGVLRTGPGPGPTAGGVVRARQTGEARGWQSARQ
jgi:hypothetical protein